MGMGAKVYHKEEIEREFVRILDQGTTAIKRVVDAYVAQRTPERDLHWLAVQMGKEFGAITLQYQRSLDILRRGEDERRVGTWVRALVEEAEHYLGYREILSKLLKGGPIPVDGIYNYVYINVVDGKIVLDEAMVRYKDRWPENFHYFTRSLHYMETLPPWGAKAVAAQIEGGAVSWHWAMSEIPPIDDFCRDVAALEKTIVEDELHHGPEAIRALADSYSDELGVDVEAVFQAIRELRYLEVRQRNEQFLHPLSEQELKEIGRDILEDCLEPTPLFSRALFA
jgi:hypothetical protein